MARVCTYGSIRGWGNGENLHSLYHSSISSEGTTLMSKRLTRSTSASRTTPVPRFTMDSVTISPIPARLLHITNQLNLNTKTYKSLTPNCEEESDFTADGDLLPT